MENVNAEKMSGFVQTDEITDLWGYLLTIDWSEGWLLGLVGFHICLTAFTVLTRHHYTLQGLIFFVLLLSVRSSEIINEFAAKHWKRFSRQQYFDSHGLFISVVFSMPVLFNCLMMVINWLWMSSNMMVKLRRVELEVNSRSSSKESLSNKTESSDQSSSESKKDK